MKTIVNKLKELPLVDKIYTGTVIPLWITLTIYIFLGIPVGGFFGFL